MIEKLKKIDWKDVIGRAGKTFAQAFVASISVDSLATITDTSTAKAVLYSVAVAGFSAGVSAVWNMAKSYLKKENGGY